MVESIKDLRKIVQKKKKEVYYLRYSRIFSIYITKLFLYTPITPNQATLLGILITITGSLLLLADFPYPVLGGFFLILGLIFDCVDGEIARYRKSSSLKGAFIDDLSFYLIETLPFATLTLYALYTYNNYIFVLLGLSSLFSLMMTRIMVERRHFLLSKSVLEDRQKIKAQIYKKSNKIINAGTKKTGNFLLLMKWFYGKVYHIFILPGIVSIIIITSIFRHQEHTLIIYGIIAPIFLLISLIYQFYTIENDKFLNKILKSIKNKGN